MCSRNRTSGCTTLQKVWVVHSRQASPRGNGETSAVVRLCHPTHTMFAANATTPLPTFSGPAREEGPAQPWQKGRLHKLWVCTHGSQILAAVGSCARYRCSLAVPNLRCPQSLNNVVLPAKEFLPDAEVRTVCSMRLPDAHIFTQLPSHHEEFDFKWKREVQLSPEGNKLRCIISEPISGNSHSNIVITLIQFTV